jgi:hypothetical protein
MKMLGLAKPLHRVASNPCMACRGLIRRVAASNAIAGCPDTTMRRIAEL